MSELAFQKESDSRAVDLAPSAYDASALAYQLLAPLASLKLTVALFAMAIFIIFAGTLAQTDQDIWEAIDNYFRTPIAWIDFQIFFPASFFPSQPQVPGGFYFPGGWLIGLVMVLNLIAAHSLRFRIQADGSRLIAGFVTIVVGVLITWLVVASGSNADGVQHDAWIEWSTLWGIFKLGLAALWIASGYAWIRLKQQPETQRWLLFVAGVPPILLGVLTIWLVLEGESARLDDSGMRILWQLLKGGFAGLVLLAGCIMVFRKRAGIVLLHGGILLMMFSELLVGTMAEEGQMHIREGETVNYIQDTRQVELALIDRSDPRMDDVVVVPQSILLRGKMIEHSLLPVRVEVLDYYRNSVLQPLEADEKPIADKAAGLTRKALEARPGAGADSNSAVDLASAYVRFSKPDGSVLGTYLLSQFLNDQPLEVDGKTYDVSLRFKQTHKPYSITLLDVRKDDYLGTNTPRNYSSDVRLVDAMRNVDRNVKIWMNNPLRYAGETFYQSSYNVDQTGTELTGLQVVTNTGWMIPYVACMIVATGMLAQFSVVLTRFLNRRANEEEAATRVVKKARREKQVEPQESGTPELAARYFPFAIVAIFAIWLLGESRVPSTSPDKMDLYAFGKLPIVEGGRVKPFDSLARNTLRVISDKQTFRDDADKKQPAIRWLLDVVARPEIADKHRVFRIENLEVLDTLGLSKRKGFRYSVDEIRPKVDEFNRQVELAREQPARDLSLYQRKILELDRRIRTYTLVQASFRTLPFPAFPTEEEYKKDPKATTDRLMRIKEILEASVELDRRLEAMQAPLAVPMQSAERGTKTTWLPYTTAWTEAYRQTIRGEKPNDATMHLTQIFDAYESDNALEFNSAIASYEAAIAADPPVIDPAVGQLLDLPKTKFEAFFNHWQPFLNSAALYLVSFVLACVAWLGWRPFNRAAFWLITFTLVVHTLALVARVYISGRPPVTNLYSSAVFIGWGCVLLGLILEAIYRMGIGNVVAAISGFNTLLIAHFLAGDGDTFTVLQAVLDTQFWLATHVVCITLGYATTFVAGLLGVLYVVIGVLSPGLTPALGKTLARATYGIICFALFFSFVGTVLGGLWADDSWGRFWGWDPKENGALIIVLWNALVLHARWDGMVKDRGMSVLAIGGNIATSWSWFGVNELGVGLHSYGFTEGVLLALGLFVLSQLILIGLGVIPKQNWLSFRRHGIAGSES